MQDEIHSILQNEKRKFIQDYLSRLDCSGGEQSPPLARRLPDDKGRTGGLVGFPVLGLAILAAVRHLLADAVLQLGLGDNFTEVTRSHLLSLKAHQIQSNGWVSS